MEDEIREHRELLNELRERMSDVLKPHHDDLKLLKFLKARKFDLNAAEDMLRKHIRNTEIIGLDRLLVDFTLPKKSLYFSTAFLGYDSEGALLRILSIGTMDLKGLSMSHTHVEAAKCAAVIMERDKQEQKQRYRETGLGGDDKQVYIIDLKGLSWTHLVNKRVSQLAFFLLNLYESNYPESLKHAYVVNVPSFFSLIYNFVKAILPSEILAKVSVISGSDKCKQVLTRVFDPSLIPASLGGTRTDPDGDPNCYSLYPIRPGTPVPHEFYLSTDLSKDPAAKKTTVHNQSIFKEQHLVTEPRSVLAWSYQTGDGDIGMSVWFRQNDGSEAKCLQPMSRVNTQKFMEIGFLECEEPGIYEVVFDNSYSWWFKKRLFYKVTVVKPGEEIPDF